MAWDTISMPNSEGGLSILSFQQHGTLLKLCYTSQLVEGQAIEWVKMTHLFIRECLKHGPQKRETRTWSPSEALLLGANIHTSSKTVNSILKI